MAKLEGLKPVAEIVERAGRFGRPEKQICFIHDGIDLPIGTKLYALTCTCICGPEALRVGTQHDCPIHGEDLRRV